jgi:hypothetical protein
MPSLRLARHDPAATARYQAVKQLAAGQQRVLSGTPGTLKRRSRRGTEYWAREHIRADGRKDDEHFGTVAATTETRVHELRGEIELARELAGGSSTLRVLGYQRVERKTAAVLAIFFNRGLFQAGLTLVGSHAYGVLLNELGVSAPGYRTQDIDVARAQPLSLASTANTGLLDLLNESGLAFHPVPGLPSHRPSGSFKLPGAEALAVDLLAPGARAGGVVEVRELGAHAQTVPLLEFLVEEPVDAIVLSPNQVIPLRVPAPERFVLHKLYSSQARRSARDKIRKDLEQAAILAAAVEEETPGRLAEAFRALPVAGKAAVANAARPAAAMLGEKFPEAQAALLALPARLVKRTAHGR